MTKNLLKHLGLIVGILLLNSQVLADNSSSDVVAAINSLKNDSIKTINSNSNTSNKQLTTLFDETFKGDFNQTSGKLEGLSTLDTKITLYLKNFYAWFTTKIFAAMDFISKNKTNENNIHKLLSQEIGYNLQKNSKEKLNDSLALLAQPVETGENNIDTEYLGIDTAKDKTISPYGSLSEHAPSIDKVPNMEDLVGKDVYDNNDQKNQARLFISYLLGSVPPPKTFYFPDKKDAKNQKLTIYLPYASEDKPYTTFDISTKPKTDTKGFKSLLSSLTGNDSDYDQMVKYLKQDSKYFQKYKMKVRIINVLRSLYTESMLRSYQDRTKDLSKKDDKSLVEQEKELAFEGLDKKYYDDLKTKTTADVNLEMLRAINKASYFLYKIHQDNERMALIMAASGLQLAGQDSKDESDYIKPIGAIIENRCWDLDKASEDRKQICENPALAAAPKQTGPQ